MPELNKLLDQARDAIYSGEASRGDWPPKLSSKRDKEGSAWWGNVNIIESKEIDSSCFSDTNSSETEISSKLLVSYIYYHIYTIYICISTVNNIACK